MLTLYKNEARSAVYKIMVRSPTDIKTIDKEKEFVFIFDFVPLFYHKTGQSTIRR
jgi:hypothetical protein